MVMFKILGKSLRNHFRIFQAFEIFTKEIFSKNSGKFYHVRYDIFDDLAKPHALGSKISPSKPFKTIMSIFEV